jgi:hypothetical protein
MSVDKKLRVIPEPKPGSRTLLLPKEGESLPLVECDADLNLLCGNCNAILAEGVMENQIKNIVICCPICKCFNEIS